MTILIEDIEKNIYIFDVNGNRSINFSQEFFEVGEFQLEAFDSDYYSLSKCKIKVNEEEIDYYEEDEIYELDLNETDLVLGLIRKNTDLNICLKNCSHNGKCIFAANNSFQCLCQQNFTGNDCSFNKNLCSRKQCMNGGECIEKNLTSFECFCNKFYYGNRCQFFKNDLCENKTCSSQGYCFFDSKTLNIKCKCFKYYSGENCEISDAEIIFIKTTIKISTIVAIVMIILFFLFILFLDCIGIIIKKKKTKRHEKIIYKPIYIN